MWKYTNVWATLEMSPIEGINISGASAKHCWRSGPQQVGEPSPGDRRRTGLLARCELSRKRSASPELSKRCRRHCPKDIELHREKIAPYMVTASLTKRGWKALAIFYWSWRPGVRAN